MATCRPCVVLQCFLRLSATAYRFGQSGHPNELNSSKFGSIELEGTELLLGLLMFPCLLLMWSDFASGSSNTSMQRRQTETLWMPWVAWREGGR